MADTSKIEWTDSTWNPITGCTLVSEGCRHCYAARLAATRLKHHPSRKGLARINAAGEAKFTGEVRFNEQWLDQPLRWRKPRMIFVCAHGDLFHESVPDEWIDRVFAVMALSQHHTFQVLTKRPERAREYFDARQVGDPWADAADYIADLRELTEHPAVLEPQDMPLPNVWLGTSVEDQATADDRIPHLLASPAAVRFVSAEPLLGPVELHRWLATANVTCKACGHPFWLHDADPCDHAKWGSWTLACPNCGGCVCENGAGKQPFPKIPDDWIERKAGRFDYVHPEIPVASKIDWIIVGGESGPGARDMHPDWSRSLRDQCGDASVAFFMKQMAHKAPIPDDLMIRQMPAAAGGE